MADQRGIGPDPAAGAPALSWRPGLGEDLLRELAPLLAEDGIDVETLTADDLPAIQAALDRAVERLNLARFTPVGRDRQLAVATLRQAVEALTEDDPAGATSALARAQPEAEDDRTPTVAACIGLALGLLDTWLTGPDRHTPAAPSSHHQPPATQRAATDILALAGKGRAFRCLDRLIIGHGGEGVLHGSVLALTVTITAWAADTNQSVSRILLNHLR